MSCYAYVLRQKHVVLYNQLRPEYFLQLYLYAADKSTAPRSKRESIVFN